MNEASNARSHHWPDLPLEAWEDTYATLHLWTQIVGKVRLTCTPPINHGWHVTLFLTSAGFTTTPVPFAGGSFEIEFDFVEHRLLIRRSDGGAGAFPLSAMSVAAFHRRLMDTLRSLDVEVRIHGRPNEVPDPIPFEQDEVHAAYDPEYASRFWRVMHRSALVFGQFRGRFIGKCSPVHYFWGAPDLAVTRFSGRRAPEHPGGVLGLPDEVVREAYSHEVSSCGFWPGGGAVPYPAFYTYAYPEPPGYRDSDPGPLAAFYSDDLREFILPYNAVRTSSDPEGTLLHFLQNTYENAAELGGWDRSALEREAAPPS